MAMCKKRHIEKKYSPKISYLYGFFSMPFLPFFSLYDMVIVLNSLSLSCRQLAIRMVDHFFLFSLIRSFSRLAPPEFSHRASYSIFPDFPLLCRGCCPSISFVSLCSALGSFPYTFFGFPYGALTSFPRRSFPAFSFYIHARKPSALAWLFPCR